VIFDYDAAGKLVGWKFSTLRKRGGGDKIQFKWRVKRRGRRDDPAAAAERGVSGAVWGEKSAGCMRR